MTHLYFDNYRGFSGQFVELAKVNFLVGENSTGKSSVLDLMDVFGNKRFWLFSPDFIPESGLESSFSDLISAASKNRKNFTIGAVDVDGNGMSANGMFVTYENSNGSTSISRITVFTGQICTVVNGDLSSEKIGRLSVKRVINTTPRRKMDEALNFLIETHHSRNGFRSKTVPENYHGAPIMIIISEYIIRNKIRKNDDGFGFDIKIPKAFSYDFVNIAPIRAMPRRTFDGSMGEFKSAGEHTPYLIRKMLKVSNFRSYLEDFGRESGLFDSIGARVYGKSPTAPFEIEVELGEKSLSLNNVGLGVSQSLPIVVEVFLRREETFFAIQQPEVHLHPKAQASFGGAIHGLAKKQNKLFAIETHSDFAIDRFRIECRKSGYVGSKIFFFSKKGGFNSISEINILEDGCVASDQPSEYRDFFLNESIELLG